MFKKFLIRQGLKDAFLLFDDQFPSRLHSWFHKYDSVVSELLTGQKFNVASSTLTAIDHCYVSDLPKARFDLIDSVVNNLYAFMD